MSEGAGEEKELNRKGKSVKRSGAGAFSEPLGSEKSLFSTLILFPNLGSCYRISEVALANETRESGVCELSGKESGISFANHPLGLVSL